MTKEEMIAASKKAVKQKEEKSKEGSNFNYEEIVYAPCIDKSFVVWRFLGGTPYKREKPTDGKIVNISNIVGDDGKNYEIIFPSKEDKTHFLWRFINKVLSYKWDNTKPDGSKKIYTYIESHPEIVNRILHNGKKDYHQGDKGALPQQYFIVNVIDYMDDWCKQNKHSKIASKGMWQSRAGVIGYNKGLSGGFFDKILTKVIEPYGWMDEYQTVVFRDSDKGFDAYDLYHIVNDAARLKRYGVEKYVKTDFEDEKDYTLYDLDKLFKVSSYQKINKVWGLFIQEVDKKLKTNFYDELQDLIKQEKEKLEKNKENKDEDIEEVNSPDIVKSSTSNKSLQDAIDEFQNRKIRREAKKENEEVKKQFDLNNLIDIFPYLQSMSKEDKSLIIGYDEINNELIWKDGLQLYECSQCGEITPDVKICPYCGTQYE